MLVAEDVWTYNPIFQYPQQNRHSISKFAGKVGFLLLFTFHLKSGGDRAVFDVTIKKPWASYWSTFQIRKAPADQHDTYNVYVCLYNITYTYIYMNKDVEAVWVLQCK